ncbi:unnamed protein product [Lupinus luteus]|uniref:Uncharacterized protein n=1 Tax=Lupinus luteus TaxID=3873 RepID=A0AAV1YFJ3_LUPLU
MSGLTSSYLRPHANYNFFPCPSTKALPSKELRRPMIGLDPGAWWFRRCPSPSFKDFIPLMYSADEKDLEWLKGYMVGKTVETVETVDHRLVSGLLKAEGFKGGMAHGNCWEVLDMNDKLELLPFITCGPVTEKGDEASFYGYENDLMGQGCNNGDSLYNDDINLGVEKEKSPLDFFADGAVGFNVEFSNGVAPLNTNNLEDEAKQ